MGSPQGLKLPPNCIMLHHTCLTALPELTDPEMTKIWKEWYDAEWSKDASTFWIGPEGPNLRVIPTTKALLKCDHPVETCLHLDGRAEFDLSRPTGKKLSVDEALAVLNYAQDSGLVPTVDNVTSPFGAICFCCSESCVVINSAMRYGTLTKQLAKSRFQAEVNENICTGCKLCTRRCQFGAITMEEISEPKKKLKVRIDIEKCWGCGQCILKCKPQAISLKLVRPATHIPGGKIEDSEQRVL